MTPPFTPSQSRTLADALTRLQEPYMVTRAAPVSRRGRLYRLLHLIGARR